jgi:hypothetical protein
LDGIDGGNQKRKKFLDLEIVVPFDVEAKMQKGLITINL